MSAYVSEIDKHWQYLRNQNLLPLLAAYGKKYKQYLTSECTSDDIEKYRSQLKLFSPQLLTLVELVAEMDIINHLKYSTPHYHHLVPNMKHIYAEQFWFIHSFRQSRTNLASFIFYLNELIHNKTIHNQNKKASLILGFHLALDMFNKYFADKKSLH